MEDLEMLKDKIARWLWAIIWKKWLWNDFYQEYGKVIKVKGWRTALVETPTSRVTITPLFWPLKK